MRLAVSSAGGCDQKNRKGLDMLSPISGSNWNNGSNAGVFALNLNNDSGNSNTNVGFRDSVHTRLNSGLLKMHTGRLLSGLYQQAKSVYSSFFGSESEDQR